MSSTLISEVVVQLCEINLKQGYATYDDLMDLLESHSVPLTATDKIAQAFRDEGGLLYEYRPSDDEIEKRNADASQPEYYDYAQIDYEQTFAEILELDPGLSILIEFVREIRPAQQGEAGYYLNHIDEANAKERLFQMCLRSVLRVALNTAKKDSIEIADAIQTGTLGLMEAIEKYNSSGSNMPFLSYASFWIYQYIGRNNTFRGNGCYFPVHISDTIHKVEVAMDSFSCTESCSGNCQKCKPLMQWIAMKAEIDIERIKHIFSYMQSAVSVDEILENDPYDECLSDDGLCEERLFESCANYSYQRLFDEQLNKLSTKEAKVLRRRFGFDGKEPWTLEQCGTEMGITRERVRQIEAKAIRRLRHPCFRKIDRQILGKIDFFD